MLVGKRSLPFAYRLAWSRLSTYASSSCKTLPLQTLKRYRKPSTTVGLAGSPTHRIIRTFARYHAQIYTSLSRNRSLDVFSRKRDTASAHVPASYCSVMVLVAQPVGLTPPSAHFWITSPSRNTSPMQADASNVACSVHSLAHSSMPTSTGASTL